ncbi:hypothetical protein SORBI_3002G017100, partial [Sorghum bicolor]
METTLPLALTTDDLIEEFFLRLPPEDPASLVHAALVCKRWRRILTDRGFRRRFCEHHHRRPPLLGYFRYGPTTATTRLLFTPTSSFRPRNAGHRFMKALDSRHGRVLISHNAFRQDPSACRLSVLDPITGHLLSLPRLPLRKPLPSVYNFTWNAVVLCASSGLGCDDSGSDCHCQGRPFLVIFIGTSKQEVYAYVYSSQAGAWSHTSSVARDTLGLLISTRLDHRDTRASAVARDAVYFKFFQNNVRILKYDLGAQEISSVDLPDKCRGPRILLLTDTEYGGLLGVATVGMSRIDLWWSSEAGPDGCFRWEPPRVIELQPVPHANPNLVHVVDIVHSLGAIIIRAHDGVFSLDIESKRMTKLCEDNCTSCFVPYLSFCTPALGAITGEGPSS